MSRTASLPTGRLPSAAQDDSPLWPSVGVAAAVYFALSLLYFLPAFAPGRQIFGTDYLGGGYMFYHFIGERLAAGELPKWIPYVFGGMPLAANPGSTYHPVHYLADLLLPTSKVLTVVFVFQFWMAGLGMYLLARELDCRRWVAFVAGLAFQFTGITMSWVYAGHDGRIMVATMAPLFFFFLHRGIRTLSIAPFAGAAAVLGFALLSFQIQNSYYLLLSAAIWALFCLFHLGVAKRPAALGRAVAMGLAAVAFGFLLASVNFLPFLEYMSASLRGAQEGGRGYEYSISYSMPEAEVLSLAVPEQAGVSIQDPETGEPLFPAYQGENGFKLHTEYVGAFVLVLLALGGYYSRRDRRWWFFAGLGLFFLVMALGGNTPLYRVLYEVLPGVKQFRAPSLSFFVVAMSLVVMAALTLERIAVLRAASGERRPAGAAAEERLDVLNWIVAAVVGLAFVGAMAAGAEAAAGWGRFTLFAGLVALWLWLWTARKTSSTVAAVALAAVAVADLWVIDRRFFHTVVGPEDWFAEDDVAAFLASQPQPSRVWTFPLPQHWRGGGSYGGNYLMLFGVDQVAGEHPNPLQHWVEYLGPGEQSYIDWHNLLRDPAVVNTPEGQAIAFQAQEGFLDAANVRYVVSMAPLAHPGFREVYRGSALVYENTQALPRAYLVPEVVEVPEGEMLPAMLEGQWDPERVAFVPESAGFDFPGGPLQGEVQVVEYTPDRVVLRSTASRPALLVLADNAYEGWEATVDGLEVPVRRVNHTFRGIRVESGTHEVVFQFRPDELYTGLYLTVGGLLLLAGYGAFLLVRRRRRAPADASAGTAA